MHGPNSENIKQMFGSIANGYDSANTVLSGGIHHLWKKEVVKLSGVQKGFRVLDCATGTGDLAFEFKRAVGVNGQVTATDFCSEMLAVAGQKSKTKGIPLILELADVTNLRYPDASFDVASIAFGIRNVNDPLKALNELSRVVRPGGRVMVLEFGQPTLPVFKQAYNFYSKFILPQIGGAITGQPSAYKYLQSSSADFPCRENFIELMKQTGRFEAYSYKSLSGGIAYIYTGTVARNHII